jgi:hypothetical protein
MVIVRLSFLLSGLTYIIMHMVGWQKPNNRMQRLKRIKDQAIVRPEDRRIKVVSNN